MTYRNKSIDVGDLVCFTWDKVTWDKIKKVGVVISPEPSALFNINKFTVLWNDKSRTKEWASDLERIN